MHGLAVATSKDPAMFKLQYFFPYMQIFVVWEITLSNRKTFDAEQSRILLFSKVDLSTALSKPTYLFNWNSMFYLFLSIT